MLYELKDRFPSRRKEFAVSRNGFLANLRAAFSKVLS
jgi:hypothetical protein